MNKYLELLRINELYKNVTVLVGIIFALFVFNTTLDTYLIIKMIFLLILTCAISSANYVVNAITDMRYDLKHPAKKRRPLPSKKISVLNAYITLFVLFVFGLAFSYVFFDILITVSLLSLFIASIMYNLNPIRLKNIPHIDVISESVNNPIRFSVGWFFISNQMPNIFLLLLAWSLACVLMTGKRTKELKTYKANAKKYRQVFKYYSLRSLKMAFFIYLIISIVFLAGWLKTWI